MDYHTIQTPNKAWRDAIKFHLITQFFQHPQTTVKCPSFVLPSNVFRFSLKEIGNLLGRLATLTNKSCFLKASYRSPHFRIPKRFVTSRGQNAVDFLNRKLWFSSARRQKNVETSEISWEIPTHNFAEELEVELPPRDSYFMTATHCLFIWNGIKESQRRRREN